MERFDGRVEGSSLLGLITFVREPGGKTVDTLRVRLDRIPFPRPGSQDDSISGLYSNVSFSSRGGELHGFDVVIVANAATHLVLFTEYAGGPQGPFALTATRWGGDTLTGLYGPATARRLTIIREGGFLRFPSGTQLTKQAGLEKLLRRMPTACRRKS